MAIPKKGSRPISVEGNEYRWLVRRKPTYSQANGWTPMTLAVSSANSRSSTLVATLDTNRPDAWVASGDVAVNPRNVSAIIRRALAAGWNPAEPGKPFQLSADVADLESAGVPPNAAQLNR